MTADELYQYAVAAMRSRGLLPMFSPPALQEAEAARHDGLEHGAGIRDLRAGSGTTVLVTTSPLLLARCDRVVLLTSAGRQLTGAHADLLDDPDYANAVAR